MQTLDISPVGEVLGNLLPALPVERLYGPAEKVILRGPRRQHTSLAVYSSLILHSWQARSTYLLGCPASTRGPPRGAAHTTHYGGQLDGQTLMILRVAIVTIVACSQAQSRPCRPPSSQSGPWSCTSSRAQSSTEATYPSSKLEHLRGPPTRAVLQVDLLAHVGILARLYGAGRLGLAKGQAGVRFQGAPSLVGEVERGTGLAARCSLLAGFDLV
eukprot:scaffold3680_cov381-Prasinococcus_capsulatus_cf.AAC.2